jgi:hypothetical protein
MDMSRSLARENTRAFRNFTVDASVLVQIQANQQGPKKKMQGLPKDIPFRRLPVVLIADDYVPLTTSELNTIHQHLQVNIVNTAVARNPDSTIIESRGEDGSGEDESIQGDQKLEGSAHELDDSEGDNSEERDGDSLMEEVSPCAQKVVFTRMHKVLATRNNEAFNELEDFIDLELPQRWKQMVEASDAKQWIEAASKEFNALLDNQTYKLSETSKCAYLK